MSKTPRVRRSFGPYKLTDELKTVLLSALRSGVHMETAAALAGLCRDTLYQWLRAGRRDPNGPCGDFVKDADKAIAEAEASHVRNIRDAGEKDWKASAWILMHRHPERWKSVVVVKEEDGNEEADLDQYSNEELNELYDALETTKRKIAKRKLSTAPAKSTH